MGLFKRFFGRSQPAEAIIVVSGLPRSGTSMTMKMLEAGGLSCVLDGIRAADDDNPKGYYEDERVKDLAKTDDKAWVAGARGKVLKVISYLLKHLPKEHHYKVLLMHRELTEVLASQAKMLKRRGNESATEDQRMVALYQKQTAQVERMLADSSHFEYIGLVHREVLKDPLTQARRIRDFLGLELDVEAMASVVDKTLYRNRAADAKSGTP